MAYKGMMLSGVPNSAFTVGYTNSSWTLKARPGLQRVCRCGVSGASSHLQPSPGRLGLRVRLPHPQLHGRGRVYSPGAAQRLESVASEETALCSVQLGPGAAAQPAHAKRQPRPAPPERTRPTQAFILASWLPRHEVPRADPAMERHALLDFGAGYIQRSIDELPKQGAAWPWRLRMNYVADVLSIRHGALADSAMEFRRPHAKPD